MTTWAKLLVVLTLTYGSLGAPIFLCPEQCSCTIFENSAKAHCKSFEFLRKALLSPEQIKAIVSIDVNGPRTKTIPDLTHFRNLKHLSVTSMKMQQIIAARLPKSLEYLDLSKNSITQLPQDLHLLPALKEVILLGNPISCDCDSLFVRDALLEKSVSVTKSVKCASPEDLRGKLWLSVTCKNKNADSLFGEMQGDAPFEGSGSGDILVVTETEPNERADSVDTIEGEFIPIRKSNIEAAPTEEPREEPTTEMSELEEGSGSEPETTTPTIIVEEKHEPTTVVPDYDEETEEDLEDLYTLTELPLPTERMLDVTPVKACNFNCSTPAPISDGNDTNVSDTPNFYEGLRILGVDMGLIPEKPITTTITTVAPTTAEPTIIPLPTTPVVVPEVRIIKENKTLTDTEIIDLKTGNEKENIEQPKESHSTFIFLSVLLLIIVCLVIYAIVKKRSLNRARLAAVPPHKPEEKEKMLEDIELVKKVMPENEKTNGTHETIPLMNGHNENQHKNADEGLIPDTNDVSNPPDEGEDDVDLRPKKEEQENLLTPEAKRVTIKACEIPNSTPKTPILVTRRVNSDGSIVTTPAVDQNVL